MSWGGRGSNSTWKHFLPGVVVDVKFIEIVHTIRTIIATKDENGSSMNNSDMSVPRSWRDIIGVDSLPGHALLLIQSRFEQLIDVEDPEIISSVDPIIASEDVNIILKSHTGVE